MPKNITRTRDLLNVKSFPDNGWIHTQDGFQLVYMIVQPYNIGVLGTQTILGKIRDLKEVLESILNMEIVSICSTQNFDENIRHLERRLEIETRPIVRLLLEQDIEHFNTISVSMATSKEFLFIFRFRNETHDSIHAKMAQYKSIIRERGFRIQVSSKHDIMKTLAVYWGQDMYSSEFYDFDGQQYLGEYKK